MRRKVNLHNFMLKATAWIMGIVWIVSACLLDSASWVPFIACVITGAWLCTFAYANGWTNDYYGDGDDE